MATFWHNACEVSIVLKKPPLKPYGHTAAASRVCRNSLELWWLKYIVVYLLLGLAKQDAGKPPRKGYIRDLSLFVQAKNTSVSQTLHFSFSVS